VFVDKRKKESPGYVNAEELAQHIDLKLFYQYSLLQNLSI